MTQTASYTGRAGAIPKRKRGKVENLLGRAYHSIMIGSFILCVAVLFIWATITQLFDFGRQFGAWLFTQPGVSEFWHGWGFLVKWGLSIGLMAVLVFVGLPALNRAYERRRRSRH